MNRIIDLHTHMMPGVDDGAESVEETAAMARMASQGGTEAIVLTPHTNVSPEYDVRPFQIESLTEFVRSLVKENHIPLKIFQGAEIMAGEHVPDQLKCGELLTLNHTRYCLIEFEFDERPARMDQLLTRVASEGFYPILAHPERYFGIQADLQWIREWRRRGWLIQVNKGSITGSFGREEENCAHALLEDALADIIASDAHNTDWRNPDMEKLYRYVSDLYGAGYAGKLFYQIPASVLAGKRPYELI